MNTLLVNKVMNSFTEHIARPAEGGLLETVNSTNVELLDVVKNLGITAITILLLVQAFKAKAAVAAVVGALFVGALLFFGLNGGFVWIGELITNEFS